MGVKVDLEKRTVENTGTEAITLAELIEKISTIAAGDTATLDPNTKQFLAS